MSAADIAERIKPVGDVYLTGDLELAAPAKPAAPRDGASVYLVYCSACHTSGVAGAPVKGNAIAWKARLAQGEQMLFDHAWKGFNAMPAKGTCSDCSEDEIKSAIAYLTEGL
jgi:cytochrome c5